MKCRQLRFGSGFRVIFGNRRTQVAQMVIPPGGSEGDSHNRHGGADQWLFVIAGSGVAIVGGKQLRLRKNTLLLIEQGEQHQIRCTGSTPLRTINFYSPPAYTSAGNPKSAGKP